MTRRVLAELAGAVRDALLVVVALWMVGAALGVVALGFRMVAGW